MTICDTCGETWLAAQVAHALDRQLTEMLAAELVAIHAFTEVRHSAA